MSVTVGRGCRDDSGASKAVLDMYRGTASEETRIVVEAGTVTISQRPAGARHWRVVVVTVDALRVLLEAP